MNDRRLYRAGQTLAVVAFLAVAAVIVSVTVVVVVICWRAVL